MLMGDGAGHPGGNDAMSTSGESVNQNIPPPPPGGEDVGGSLSPQESGLPVPSNQWLVMAVDGQPVGDNVPDSRALVGPVTGPRVVDSDYQQLSAGALGEPMMSSATVPVRGPDPSVSMAAAAASTLTQAAMTAAQQSAIAGQQAQQATQQSAAAGQQAQQAFNVGASALQQTNALRDETSQMLGQVKTGLETLH